MNRRSSHRRRGASAEPLLRLRAGTETVEVRVEDLFLIVQLSEASGLRDLSPESVRKTFLSGAPGSRLGLPEYRSVLQRLLSGDAPRGDVFERVFDVLQRGSGRGGGGVATCELMSALLLLCGGDLSGKLSSCFGLLGEARRVEVTDLSSLIFPPLAVLLAVKYSGVRGAALYAALVRNLSPLVVRSLSPRLRESRVGSDEFLRWMVGGGGAALVPWLPLLASSDVLSTCPPVAPRAGAASAELDFFFFGGYRLQFTAGDMAVYLHFVRESHLWERDAKDLYNSLLGISNHRMISAEVFAQFVDRNLSRGGEGEIQGGDPLLLPLFKSIFHYYDTYACGSVSLVEISAGLSVMARGDWLQKLSISFKCFDSDNDGSLSHAEFTRFLFSHLMILSQFSSAVLPLNSLLPVAVYSSARLLASLVWDAYNGPEVLSLPQFLDWRRKVGGRLLSWVEYLDTEMWSEHYSRLEPEEEEEEGEKAVSSTSSGDSEEGEEEDENSVMSSPESESGESSSSSPTPSPSSAAKEAEEEQEREESVPGLPHFEPVLLGGTNGEFLSFDDSSFFFLQSVAQSSQLRTTACKVVFESLLLQSSRGLIREEDFMKVLLPYTDRSDFMKEVLSDLFEFFDARGSHVADVLEIASAVSLFAGGSKSAKLLALFHTFSKTNKDELSLSRLSVFLTSVLLLLFMVSRCFQLRSSPEAPRIIASCQKSVAAAVAAFQDACGLSASACFSLETFGAWYNGGGSASCPWLELINLEKWMLDAGQEVIYSVELPPSSATLCITRSGVEKLLGCLGELPYRTLGELESLVPATRGVGRADFLESLGAGCLLLQELFDHLDTTNTGRVAHADLVVSLSQFIDVSKTDKLFHGFHMYGSKGVATRAAVSRYLFVVLWTISCLQEEFVSVQTVQAHIEHAVSSLFAWLSARGGSSSSSNRPAAEQEKAREGVAFNDFAGWYNAAGCKLIPWLELLDIRKWRTSEEGAVFSFRLNRLDHRFDLFSSDVENYARLMRESGLGQLSPAELGSLLGGALPDEDVSEEDFLGALPRLLPPQSRGERASSEFLLSVFLRLRGAEEGARVSRRLLQVCLCPMTRGDKSSKLQFAFDLLARDGTLDSRSMGAFLSALLTFVLCLSRRALSSPLPSFSTIVSTTVDELLPSIFGAPTLVPGHISFEEFAEWYISQSNNPIQWIELLSQAKWNMASWSADATAGGSSSSVSSRSGFSASSHPTISTATTRTPSPPPSPSLLVLSLPSSSLPTAIHIDCPHALFSWIAATRFKSLGLSELIAAARAALSGEGEDGEESEGKVTSDEYGAMVSSLDASAVNGSQPSFAAVYRFLSQRGARAVPRSEAVLSLLLFVDARKSAKLIEAFDLIGSSLDGSLSREEFVRCLVALFSPVLANVAQRPSYGYCSSFMSELFGEVGECVYLSKDRISLEDLSRWYEERGADQAPWIELLNLEKWPVEAAAMAAREEEAPQEEEEEEEEEEVVPAPVGAMLSLSFSMTPSLLIEVTSRDSQRYLRSVSSTRLSLHEPRGIADMFEGGESSSAAMSASEFRSALGTLIPPSEGVAGPLSFFDDQFALMARVLGSVSRHVAATGLMLYAKGKKSNKLSTAFQLFAASEGKLSASGMSDFFFALLASIVVFLTPEVSVDTLKQVRQECARCAESVMAGRASVTFLDFCEWYDSAGCDSAPWIELLDFSKWPAV